MLNIRNLGAIESIDELTKGQQLPESSHAFKESASLSDIFYDGLMISLPLFAAFFALAIYRSYAILFKLHFTWVTWLSIAVTLVAAYFISYIHELLHACFYPLNSSKTICELKTQGAHLLYCDAKVSKGRFILICLAPVLILGVLPFMVWFVFATVIPMPLSFCIVLYCFLMFVSALGDYANIFNAMRQVPRGAKIFNYGLHSYWIKE